MKKYIIKTSGKMSDVIKTLETLESIFGKDATFESIESDLISIRRNNLQRVVEKQLKENI